MFFDFRNWDFDSSQKTDFHVFDFRRAQKKSEEPRRTRRAKGQPRKTPQKNSEEPRRTQKSPDEPEERKCRHKAPKSPPQGTENAATRRRKCRHKASKMPSQGTENAATKHRKCRYKGESKIGK